MNEIVFQILLGLREEARDAEGILEAIRLVGGKKAEPALASFYRGLKKAADAGYVTILARGPGESRGRPRQRYRITREGRAALRIEARRLGRLASLALSGSKPT